MKSEIFHIDSVAYGGSGVARGADGKVCFIPRTLPGETVEAEIVAEKKRFSSGRVLRIVEASAHRQNAECEYFDGLPCPGCTYMHCDYPYEIELKQQQLHDFLVRRSLISASQLLPPYASGSRTGNRNKLVLHTSGSIRGYSSNDGRLLPVSACCLANPQINAFAAANPPRAPRETFRFTHADGALNAAECDREYLTEEIPGAGKFKVSPQGFFQTNIFIAAELVRRAVGAIAASGLTQLVELYCGVGIFSIAAAEKLPHLKATGIEYDSAAIGFARRNALEHGVSGQCRFFAGDAGKKVSALEDCRDSIMLLDPPRAGMSDDTLKAVLRKNPAKIIYISCAPDTLARDLEKFIAGGYIVKNAGLLDMFPGTAHFEVMTLLEKK